MKHAKFEDKEIVIDILAKSFQDNKSVNYIIKQDKNRLFRIRKLMEYAFEICFLYGTVILSDDKKGCALILYPHNKKMTFRSVLLDARIAFYCCGIVNTIKAIRRESEIKAHHPKIPFKHLWFIGVDPDEQNRGTGSAILNHVIHDNIPVYLETSTLKNLPWYKKHGFDIYRELDLGYTLYLLKKNN